MIEILNAEILGFLSNLEDVDEEYLKIIDKKSTTSITDDLKNGHLTSNICMIVASQLKLNPKKLSSDLANKLDSLGIFKKVESAGPGFINVTLKREDFLSTLRIINQQKEKFGESTLNSNQKVQIEFVSANPTGPLHVGHGRGAAYGDALARILSATGSSVEKEYYVNDAGRQIDILTASVIMKMHESDNSFFPQNAYKGKYIEDLGKKIEEKDNFNLTIDKSILDNLPKDPEKEIDEIISYLKNHYQANWKTVKDFSLKSIIKDIKNDLRNFNVEFNNWFYESSLGSLDDSKSEISVSINRLEENKQAYKKDGAIWLNTEDSGDDKHRVLVRDDGRATYFASDVAYHKNKIDRGFDEIINIWGADHHGYIKRIESSIEGLGSKKEKLIVKLVQFANLYKDGSKVKMSTRSGEFYSLNDLIEDIGSDAARFYYLSKQADQHLDFDIDLAKSDSKENIFYYIQYAHARIFSLEEKYKGLKSSKNIKKFNLSNIDYIKCDKLIHEISKYPGIVIKSALTYQPHLIIFYLRDLSQIFHSYYNDNHILSEEKDNQEFIINCMSSVRQIISNGLNLLGITPMQKM